MRISLRALAAGLLVAVPAALVVGRRTVVADPPPVAAAPLADSTFARLVARVSEPGGFFDTDNLISNEASYLHVLGAMRRLDVTGGAYIGVGPDQNFSYMAQVRPRIAFIVDIRRDNLLQHLFFKALFELAHNRAEYLSLLVAHPVPEGSGRDQRSIEELIAHVDSTAPRRDLFDSTRARIDAAIARYGVPLGARDRETIGRIHESFFEAGLDLRFTSFNRGPRSYYPTFRQLLLETDLTGKQGNYLAREDDFRFIKSLQERNLVIPVVGNLAGDHALREIARVLEERSETVSAFYVSNVEFYLFQDGTFPLYARNVAALPRDERSVLIRSYFGGGFGGFHPQRVPNCYSTQLLQTMASFAREASSGGYATYSDVVGKHSLDLR